MRMSSDVSQQTAAAARKRSIRKKKQPLSIFLWSNVYSTCKILIISSWKIYNPLSLSCSNIWHTSTHLVQLPAKTLKNVMLVDLENGLALVKDGMHDHAQGIHVRGRVTADGQDVFRRQVLGVGEAERREVGVPLFTRVLKLKMTRGHENTNMQRYYCQTKQKSFQHTSASEGLVEEMLKSKPMIFQDPLLLRMMFSGHRLPWTILTPLWRKDKPSEIWRERKMKKSQGRLTFNWLTKNMSWSTDNNNVMYYCPTA